MSKQNRLILIDGSGYIFRAYYALPKMSKNDGTPVNARLRIYKYVSKS